LNYVYYLTLFGAENPDTYFKYNKRHTSFQSLVDTIDAYVDLFYPESEVVRYGRVYYIRSNPNSSPKQLAEYYEVPQLVTGVNPHDYPSIKNKTKRPN